MCFPVCSMRPPRVLLQVVQLIIYMYLVRMHAVSSFSFIPLCNSFV